MIRPFLKFVCFTRVLNVLGIRLLTADSIFYLNRDGLILLNKYEINLRTGCGAVKPEAILFRQIIHFVKIMCEIDILPAVSI